AVQDAQRAMSLVRSHAQDWKIDPNRIGICGFSAGGETAALASIRHAQRQYESIDQIDMVSSRPDFAMLIYAAGLVDKQTVAENPALLDSIKLDDSVPPMFLVHAFDDNVSAQNPLLLASALKKMEVPVELHLFAHGGHGYGLRETKLPVTRWPSAAEQWLQRMQFLRRP
ncbi:MAG: alpha/beta hydrolase, partial [Planctomycetaceae bacterium]